MSPISDFTNTKSLNERLAIYRLNVKFVMFAYIAASALRTSISTATSSLTYTVISGFKSRPSSLGLKKEVGASLVERPIFMGWLSPYLATMPGRKEFAKLVFKNLGPYSGPNISGVTMKLNILES